MQGAHGPKTLIERFSHSSELRIKRPDILLYLGELGTMGQDQSPEGTADSHASWPTRSCHDSALPYGTGPHTLRYRALRAGLSLPRHSDADSFLRRDEVINALSILGDGELNALDHSVELVSTRPVVR